VCVRVSKSLGLVASLGVCVCYIYYMPMCVRS